MERINAIHTPNPISLLGELTANTPGILGSHANFHRQVSQHRPPVIRSCDVADAEFLNARADHLEAILSAQETYVVALLIDTAMSQTCGYVDKDYILRVMRDARAEIVGCLRRAADDAAEDEAA